MGDAWAKLPKQIATNMADIEVRSCIVLESLSEQDSFDKNWFGWKVNQRKTTQSLLDVGIWLDRKVGRTGAE